MAYHSSRWIMQRQSWIDIWALSTVIWKSTVWRQMYWSWSVQGFFFGEVELLRAAGYVATLISESRPWSQPCIFQSRDRVPFITTKEGGSCGSEAAIFQVVVGVSRAEKFVGALTWTMTYGRIYMTMKFEIFNTIWQYDHDEEDSDGYDKIMATL